MWGSVPRVWRILSFTLALAIGVGAPGWPQDNPPPPKPPEQSPPPPAKPPEQAPSSPTKPPEQTPPPQGPQPPAAEQGQPQVAPEAAPEPEVQEPPAKKGATLKGRILGTDRKTPLAAAVVHAEASDGTIVSSDPSDPKGRYVLGGLLPGTYTLAVEVDGGIYTLEGPVGVNSAQTFTVDLATVPASAAITPVPGIAAPPRGFCYIVQGQRPPGASFWKSPKGITLLAVTAGAVALILARSGNNDEEKPVSPSAP